MIYLIVFFAAVAILAIADSHFAHRKAQDAMTDASEAHDRLDMFQRSYANKADLFSLARRVKAHEDYVDEVVDTINLDINPQIEDAFEQVEGRILRVESGMARFALAGEALCDAVQAVDNKVDDVDRNMVDGLAVAVIKDVNLINSRLDALEHGDDMPERVAAHDSATVVRELHSVNGKLEDLAKELNLRDAETRANVKLIADLHVANGALQQQIDSLRTRLEQLEGGKK